jgi:hypothetical protein
MLLGYGSVDAEALESACGLAQEMSDIPGERIAGDDAFENECFYGRGDE